MWSYNPGSTPFMQSNSYIEGGSKLFLVNTKSSIIRSIRAVFPFMRCCKEATSLGLILNAAMDLELSQASTCVMTVGNSSIENV